MAKHQRTEKGGRFIFDQDDWTNGFAPGLTSISSGIPPLKYPVNAARTLSQIDPFRNYGFIQPGYYPQNATNSAQLGNVLVAGAINSDYTTIYGIDKAAKVQSYNSSTNTILNAGAFPHQVAGTSPVGQDVLMYQHNSGATTTQVFSLFYSYYNNANWDVGAYVNLSSFDDDFMSTIPTTPLDTSSGDGDSIYQRTQPHPMCVGADDLMYIGSGRYLHAYDGATGNNGTFISQVLSDSI